MRTTATLQSLRSTRAARLVDMSLAMAELCEDIDDNGEGDSARVDELMLNLMVSTKFAAMLREFHLSTKPAEDGTPCGREALEISLRVLCARVLLAGIAAARAGEMLRAVRP